MVGPNGTKEWQKKFRKTLKEKGGSEKLSSNTIELFSSESGGDPLILEALRGFTDRRITKCSFVFPEKVMATNICYQKT